MIDRIIGEAIGRRRAQLGLTPSALARALKLTPAQISRYESGAQGVSAATLYDLARVLDLPVAGFFSEVQPAEDFAESPLSLVAYLRRELDAAGPAADGAEAGEAQWSCGQFLPARRQG